MGTVTAGAPVGGAIWGELFPADVQSAFTYKSKKMHMPRYCSQQALTLDFHELRSAIANES